MPVAVEGEEVRFALDSPLEQDGFELSVPRVTDAFPSSPLDFDP